MKTYYFSLSCINLPHIVVLLCPFGVFFLIYNIARKPSVNFLTLQKISAIRNSYLEFSGVLLVFYRAWAIDRYIWCRTRPVDFYKQDHFKELI